MTQTIRSAAGSLLVVGLAGTELTALERAWLKLIRPAGVILFRRNIADAGQTRGILVEATRFCTAANLRCVDLEGGTVDRLRDAVGAMPSAQSVAGIRDRKLMRLHGKLIGREAKAFGFNVTLAPVLDLALPVSAGVMGTRSAAATAIGVAEYAKEFLAGLDSRGIVGCGKHFPGLGGGTVDSHLHTPAIERSYRELWEEDLAPYRELIRELPMVMVTHAAYPKTRSRELPATASKFWIQTVLQGRMSYKGLIFSDDLEMGGILKFLPMEEAAVAAIRAGMHLLEICHSPELILRCYEALIREAERSRAFRELLLERAATSGRLRRARFKEDTGRELPQTQFVRLRERVLRFGEMVRLYDVKDGLRGEIR